MTKLLLGLILATLSTIACAQSALPLKSAAWRGPDIACGSSPTAAGADLMPLDGSMHWETQNAPPGAGPWPAGYNLLVRKVCVSHGGTFADSDGYAVVGHSGPNGDHVSPWLLGKGTICLSYDWDSPVVVTGGEYFDVHAGCSSGTHYVVLQLWYVQP